MNGRVSRPFALAGACLAALAAVLVLAYFVAPVAHWDATALQGLRSLGAHPSIWSATHRFSHILDTSLLLALLAAICAAALLMRRHRQAAGALAIVAGAVLVSQLLQDALAHQRYLPILGDDEVAPSSFPSGHATAAMAVALASLLVAPSRWRVPVAVAGGAFALVVSISLVVQGWHYPSDVLGGYLVACTVGLLVLGGLRALDRRSAVRSAASAPQTSFSLQLMGSWLIAFLAGATVVGVMVLGLTHPDELASFSVANTSAVVAAIGIAGASIGLTYALTAELETG